jgi:hypothetical protein
VIALLVVRQVCGSGGALVVMMVVVVVAQPMCKLAAYTFLIHSTKEALIISARKTQFPYIDSLCSRECVFLIF